MSSCDYNGWNDAPEEEREWFDQHPEIWDGVPADVHARGAKGSRRSQQNQRRGGLAA